MKCYRLLSTLSTKQTTWAISYNLLFSIWHNYYRLIESYAKLDLTRGVNNVLTSRIVAQHYRAFGGKKVRRAHSESGRFFVPNRDSWRNPNVLELRLGNVDRESAIFFGES